MHVDLMARKEWIEREKEREVEFPFKKGRGKRNKGEKGKEKRENQFVRAKFPPLNPLYA